MVRDLLPSPRYRPYRFEVPSAKDPSTQAKAAGQRNINLPAITVEYRQWENDAGSCRIGAYRTGCRGVGRLENPRPVSCLERWFLVANWTMNVYFW